MFRRSKKWSGYKGDTNKQGEPHGKGVWTGSDGERYEGDWEDGKRHGKGITEFADGIRHEGEYRNDSWHGKGVWTHPQGQKYQGLYNYGKIHGRGLMEYPDGARFEGFYKNGERHGRGKYTYADGSTFEGEYRDGERHGLGTISFPSGEVNNLTYENGKLSGPAIEKFADGETFEGEYRDGERHGRGKYTYTDGAIFEGEYRDGERHGRGKYTHSDGGTFEGEYRGGVRNGMGTWKGSDGSSYEGEYKDDFPHGRGKFIGSDEITYEGEFKEGNWHGTGVWTNKSGDRFEGEYKEGKPHGEGVYESSDGGRFEGFYVDGEANGPAVSIYPDGGRFEGMYLGGLKHGHGVEKLANGSAYEGKWEDDFPHGIGVFTDSEGTRIEGMFKEGAPDGYGSCSSSEGWSYEGKWGSGKFHGQGAYKSAEGESYSGEWVEGKLYDSSGKQVIVGPTAYESDERGPASGEGTDKNNLSPRKFTAEESPTKAKETTHSDTGTNQLDPEILAQITGRSVEDIVADLADDGVLNFSSGSDQVNKEMIDTNRFQKSRKLKAEGGMAEVFLARDKNTGEMVVWKQAAPNRKLTAKEANEALSNEVEVLENLEHPRIPKYIDSGFIKNEDGFKVLVLIMEYVEGGSLDDEMKLFIKTGMRQQLERILRITTECCEVLEYMADLDPPLYHRDIKPHNVIINGDRGAVLIDFGLAKEVAAGSGNSLSGGGHTAGWSPPERERAITGPTTDVYSLGQMLWHMLTNEKAGIFSEKNKSQKITDCGHPEWLGAVVNEATVPDNPEKRIKSIAELKIRLENEGTLP